MPRLHYRTEHRAEHLLCPLLKLLSLGHKSIATKEIDVQSRNHLISVFRCAKKSSTQDLGIYHEIAVLQINPFLSIIWYNILNM